MTEIGLGAAMNDRSMIDLNTEIALFEIWMSDMKKVMLRQEMSYEDLRLFMFDRQYVEIEIEKKKMRLQIDEINTQIYKLNEGSERNPSVQEKKKMKLIGSNDNYHRHLKLLLESMPLVVEKVKKLGCNNHPHVHMPLVMVRMGKILDRFLSSDDHLDLKLMNDELESHTEKLELLKHDIYNMERWLDEMKMTKMKIKDITEAADVELKDHVLQFHDDESSDNELETYKYNQAKIHSFEMKLFSIKRQKSRQVAEGKKQMKDNGLDYAKIAGLRAISQYWRLPFREPKEQQLRGVYWKKLELPNKEGLCGWDELGKWPLAVQIYALKLTCCSDNQDYAVEASGDIHLLIDDNRIPCIFHVKRQILTRKDPYLLLADPSYIPLLLPSSTPMIHVKLQLRRRDKLTRSREVEVEVVDEVNLGTGKHYMLKLTHGIVVNTIVANISVHLHRSLWDSWDGKCMITVSDKHTPCKHAAVLANYKKVPVTIDYDNRCLQLLRSRICVDFFGVLEFYINCFGTNACLRFIPRDCYRHDNRQRKEALEGLSVQVKWSTS